MAPARIQIAQILCPIDFSEFSERALARAVRLAAWFDARVTALHVSLPMPWALSASAYGANVAVPAQLMRARRGREADELDRIVEPFLDDGAPIETRLVEGEPWREIQALAESLPADLLVMGTHGRSGFEHLLLGSVTEKLLRRAPCPVLTVGGTEPPASPGPLFRRIVCAADLTDASQATLDLALSLAQENLARVTLLHVVEGVLGEAGPDLYRPIPDLAPLRSALVGEARARLHQAGRAAHSFCDVAERVETGKAWRAILRVAEETCADLVVLGAHVGWGSRLLGSTANHVVRQASCPVLVVREALRAAGETVAV